MSIISTIKYIISGVDIDSLNNTIAQLESSLKRVKDDNARKNVEVYRLENRVEILNEDLIREENKVSIAESKLKEIDTLSSKLSESEERVTSLASQNTVLLETQKSLTKENESLQAKINRREEKISNLQVENDKLQEEITKKQEESSLLVQKSEDLQSTIEKNEENNSKNVAEIERLNAEIEKTRKELEQEREAVELANKKFDEINVLYSKLQKDSADEKKTLSSKIYESEELCKTLESEIESLRKTNADLIDSNTLLESEKKDQSEKIILLEKDNSDKSAKLKESEEKVTKLLNETEELQKNEHIFLSKVDKLESQLHNANEKIIELSSANEKNTLTPNDDESKIEVKDEKENTIEDNKSEDDNDDVEITVAEDSVNSLPHEDKVVDSVGLAQNNDETNEKTDINEHNKVNDENIIDEIVDESNKDDTNNVINDKEEKQEFPSETTDDTDDNDDKPEDGIIENSDDVIDEGDNQENPSETTDDVVDEEKSEDGIIENSDDVIDEVYNQEIPSETTDDTVDEDDITEDDSLPYVYDYGLIPAEKLSIPEVYDVKEEKIINSRDFFSQNENELILWRRNLQEEYLMGHARFICPECKQPVKISGHKLLRGRVCYFAHFKDSDDCPYKTGTNRTKEEIERLKYALVQESERHKRLKSVIATALQGEKSREMGVDNVECEKRINSDIPYLKWRRPDVYAEYNGRKYVFELQLSTTFVSVIVDRDIFYRLNDYNIIWIFNFEDNEEYVNLYNLMCKDIYYANKRNVFIFDADAEEKSKEKGELVLKCRWLDENGVWSPDKYVTLEMFQYDEEYHKPFIFDADKAYLEKYPEYVERRKQLENSREYLLKALMERQKHEEELEKRRDEERTNLQLELLNNDKSVERFRSGTKYGYQFDGTTILPAKYTSADAIGENGYAQVGFNRKIGLVRKDGKEIVPVEYRKIDVINNRHGIVMAQYKPIDLWLGDEHFTLRSEFDEKEQTIIKEDETGKTNYILQTNTYNYSYSQSYYGDHPICHKNFSGHSKSTLFTLVEEENYCIIWVNGGTYLLSRNRLSSVNGSYSDIISIGIDQLFIAKDNVTDLWGVIDLEGNIVTEFRYAKLIPTDSEYLIAKYKNESSTYGVIDYQGREFIEPQYEALIYLNSERFAFRKEHLWGICDRMGNVLHEAEYTYVRGVESGGLRASTLDSYLAKWKVEDNTSSYYDDNAKLCLLNDKGEIAYTERNMGQYHIRHSGDLYSILTIDNKELVNYSLSSVKIVTESTAIIKNVDGNSGFFVEDKCVFFDGCSNIEQLAEGIFKFEDIHGNIALGNISGPTCDYNYNDIKAADSCHFIASLKHRWGYGPSGEYVIIDLTGKTISSVFSSIDDFIDGYASAIYQGRKGVIDVEGNMQEKTVMNYKEYTLCEKFENYYFRNKDGVIVSEEYQKVKPFIDMFFIVKKRGETTARLFSLELRRATDNSYSYITHLVGNLFVAETPRPAYGYSNSNVYHLYRGIERLSTESYSSVVLLDNGYVALQISRSKGYSSSMVWKLAKADGTILNDREYDSIAEANENSFRVYIDGHEGSIDLDGNPIVERITCENNYVITHCFDDYGLEDPEGNVVFSLDEHISSIVITEDSVLIVCKNLIVRKYALYSIDGGQITEHKFSSITFETNNRYAVVEKKVKGHIDSLGNYIESSAESITDDGITIFVIMEKYGLRYSNGEIILPAEYSSIKYLKEKLLAVSKDSHVALFDIEGNVLTEFKYSDICCREDGSIQATRNNTIGGLDDKGTEIADILHFNGGYLQSSFGEYTVINDAEEIIVPVGYSNIELLDNDGVFALWKGTKVAIGNISKEKTEPIYESVKSIGSAFYVVSRTISKKIRTRHTGYGYRGNPYTYFSSRNVDEKKYGIIDGQLRTIVPCKYSSISDFDDNQNVTTTNAKGEKKTISLQNLKKKGSRTLELSVGMEYDAKVQSFMPIGLIVKIQGKTCIIHRKHLYKEKKEFKKGDILIAKYLGNDKNDHPLWTTKEFSNQIKEDNSEMNINIE